MLLYITEFDQSNNWTEKIDHLVVYQPTKSLYSGDMLSHTQCNSLGELKYA